MISSANDRVDREDIRQQSDETYQFWFYYDTSQYDGKKTCHSPHGLFTAMKVYLIGWNLGIKESVAGVVVIGFSVDYTIHLGHMFDVARSQGLTTRQEKFAYSIKKMGETVLAGAITTAGSTVFLLACQLTFFTAMGTLIILTVAYSLGYSLLFFMPLLRVAGPEGRVGDICHFLRGLKCACCRRA